MHRQCRIGGAWTSAHKRDPGTAGQLGVGDGHQAGAAFVTAGHQIEAWLVREGVQRR